MHRILFEIGPLEIRSYGAMIALGFLVSYTLMYAEAKRRNFYPDRILDIEFLVLVFGLVGARILHVLVNRHYYRERGLFDMLAFWRGGLAIYGGIFLAILACSAYILIKRMPYWKTTDFIAPYVALGQAFGRVGCLLNECCYGKPAGSLFFGIVTRNDGVYRYPTQLYAALALLCIFVILRYAQKKPPFDGSIFGLYLILYSFQRFFIDFLRGDTPRYIFNLTVSQIISVFVFVITLFILDYLDRRNRKWKS